MAHVPRPGRFWGRESRLGSGVFAGFVKVPLLRLSRYCFGVVVAEQQQQRRAVERPFFVLSCLVFALARK